MKQAYRFLFLFIVVVFSFGFTNRTTTCQTKEQVSHSCCSKNDKNKTSKPCKGECCIQNNTITKLEDTEKIENNKKDKDILVFITSRKIITHNIVSLSINKSVFTKIKYLKTPVFLSIKTQSWLI